jgi:nucleoside-diphosphate-sugar epimerase
MNKCIDPFAQVALPRVAIIGANGQVGAELCLFLKIMGRVEPIGIARSKVGTALLRRLGIECRHGDFRAVEEACGLLEGCTAVVDLALPMGKSPIDTKQAIKRHLAAIFKNMHDAKTFIYGSTMSIYRLDPADPFYRWYGVTKRYAEREAMKLGARSHRDVYNLRFGQVHGEMQSCSLDILERLHEGTIARVPNIGSYTVFVYSIAEAIINILAGKESPGTYTLISVPEWSWEEVLLWYARIKGISITILGVPVQSRGPFRETLGLLSDKMRAAGSHFLAYYKDLVSASLATISEELEERLRFRYTLRSVRQQLALAAQPLLWEPFDQRISVPGRRLKSLTDSRQTMEPHAQKVRAMIHTLTPRYAQRRPLN